MAREFGPVPGVPEGMSFLLEGKRLSLGSTARSNMGSQGRKLRVRIPSSSRGATRMTKTMETSSSTRVMGGSIPQQAVRSRIRSSAVRTSLWLLVLTVASRYACCEGPLGIQHTRRALAIGMTVCTQSRGTGLPPEGPGSESGDTDSSNRHPRTPSRIHRQALRQEPGDVPSRRHSDSSGTPQSPSGSRISTTTPVRSAGNAWKLRLVPTPRVLI
jgi:hypothetical protein